MNTITEEQVRAIVKENQALRAALQAAKDTIMIMDYDISKALKKQIDEALADPSQEPYTPWESRSQ